MSPALLLTKVRTRPTSGDNMMKAPPPCMPEGVTMHRWGHICALRAGPIEAPLSVLTAARAVTFHATSGLPHCSTLRGAAGAP